MAVIAKKHHVEVEEERVLEWFLPVYIVQNEVKSSVSYS